MTSERWRVAVRVVTGETIVLRALAWGPLEARRIARETGYSPTDTPVVQENNRWIVHVENWWSKPQAKTDGESK